MKRLLILTMVACLLLTGCTQTHYMRQVEVKKDAGGNVVEMLITERVIQPNLQKSEMEFEYVGIGQH